MSSSPIIEKSSANGSHLGQTRNSPERNEPTPGAEDEQHGHEVEWAELARIAFVALAAAAVWFRLWEPFPHISVIGIAATLIGGYPIFKEAFENIVERKMTMELSMTIALASSWPQRFWRVSQLGEADGPSRVFSIFSPEPSQSAVMVK
jgi:cation transport ATPase